MHQRLISLVVFAFVLGNGAGQVPVPRSEIAENSSCNDFAWLLVPVRYASALDQLGRFFLHLFLETGRARCLCLGVRLQRDLYAMILLGR